VTSTLRRDAILDATSYDALRLGLELGLGDLWAAALRVDRVGRFDDFFEIGGDSISAAALFTAIQDTFGIELPTATLLEAPTIAQLAEVIERRSGTQAAPQRPATLLLARPGRGASEPLVLVPPLQTLPAAFRNLASALSYRGPIFLLDHRPLERMDEHTQQHLQALVAAGLGPRVHLLGICWGGLLALEMARRAPDYGLRPGVVAVFDPPALISAGNRLRSRARNTPPLAAMVSRLRLYRSELGDLPWQQRPAWVMRKVKTLATIRNRNLRTEFRRDPLMTAALAYSPQTPREPVDLILTRDRADGRSRRGRRAWIRFLDAAERTHVVAGERSYDTMLGGKATELAGVVDRLLEVEGARVLAPAQ
jgi:acyl carrier protein/thioesterase domain-containing protein